MLCKCRIKYFPCREECKCGNTDPVRKKCDCAEVGIVVSIGTNLCYPPAIPGRKMITVRQRSERARNLQLPRFSRTVGRNHSGRGGICRRQGANHKLVRQGSETQLRTPHSYAPSPSHDEQALPPSTTSRLSTTSRFSAPTRRRCRADACSSATTT